MEVERAPFTCSQCKQAVPIGIKMNYWYINGKKVDCESGGNQWCKQCTKRVFPDINDKLYV